MRPYPAPVTAYIIENPAACAPTGSRSRSARLRVTSTPDWNNPAASNAPAMPGRFGNNATAPTHVAVITNSTSPCVRNDPGHGRSPYSTAPSALHAANPVSSGPIHAMPIPRCSSNAGNTSSATASCASAAALTR